MRALDQDPIAAGRELGVDTVLDGSLQRRGDRLRVAVRLLRVADGQQLWAQSFDQDFTTIFDVQDIIAARVAQAVSVRWVGSGVNTRRPVHAGSGSLCALRERPIRLDAADRTEPAAGNRLLRASHRAGIRTTHSPTRALPTATPSLASSACALRMKCFPRRAARSKRRCRSIPISRRPIRHWDTSR